MENYWIYKNGFVKGAHWEGQDYTLWGLSKILPLSASCIKKRAKSGLEVNEALTKPSKTTARYNMPDDEILRMRELSAVISMRW